MIDTDLEVLFRAWWPYPAPPGPHAVMTHLAWAQHLLQHQVQPQEDRRDA